MLRLYIYIYIYIVLFGPVKQELGVIPSGQKTFNSEHLNFSGKELNVTDIRAIISLRKKKTGHIRIINLFPSCYEFHLLPKEKIHYLLL